MGGWRLVVVSQSDKTMACSWNSVEPVE